MQNIEGQSLVAALRKATFRYQFERCIAGSRDRPLTRPRFDNDSQTLQIAISVQKLYDASD